MQILRLQSRESLSLPCGEWRQHSLDWACVGSGLVVAVHAELPRRDDDYEATYLPSFFTSAARNADAVDLLWINVMRKGDKCVDVSPYIDNATNIQ